MTDEELIAMFRATGDYQNAAIADRIAALRACVAELESELAAIRREAETNQKWAFLEWRDRAERAKADNARLREALEKIVEWKDFPETGDTWPTGGKVSYFAAYGSNGERDYMRDVARTALTAKEPK
jgi:hypothetical protein